MNNFLHGIRGKIASMVIIQVLVLVALLGIVTFSFKNLMDNYKHTDHVGIPAIQNLGELKSAMNTSIRYAWGSYIADLKNPELRAQRAEKGKKAMHDFTQALAILQKLELEGEQKDGPSRIDEAWRGVEPILSEIFDLVVKNTQKDNDAARQKIESSIQTLKVLEEEVQKLLDSERAFVNGDVDGDIKEAQKQLLLILILSVSAIVVIATIAYFISRSLVGQLLEITVKIGHAGVEVNGASVQLSHSAQGLSEASTEGAASLQETVASVEELSSMVKLNSDNAKQAASLSHSSRTSAEQGESEIKQLISAMGEISQTSKKVEEIINVIDDIAFQTNLLALNAAVEAARAGEQGKGFAVVAEAVRGLAARSASAAKEIATMIHDSVEKTANGSKVADRSGEVFKNIVASVKKVSDLNNEIASASVEQSNGLGQISKAMNQLDANTQNNARAASEAAASAEEMSAQSQLLQQMVGDLAYVVEGRRDLEHKSVAIKAKVAENKIVKKTEAPKATVKTSHGVAPKVAKAAATVVATPTPAKVKAEEVIPFDDAPAKKKSTVGSTQGF